MDREEKARKGVLRGECIGAAEFWSEFSVGDGESPPAFFRLFCAGRGIWRIKGRWQGGYEHEGAVQTLAADLGEPLNEALLPLSVSQKDGNSLEIRAGTESVFFSPDPFSLEFKGENGAKKLRLTGVFDSGEETGARGELTEDECIFGTGQRFNGANQRGRRIEMTAIDYWCETEGNSYVPVPFLLSTVGYGLLHNRYERSVFDLGHADPGEWRFFAREAPLDVYIFTKDDPKDILFDYSGLSGFAPEPAEWLYGIHVSRHGRLKEFASPEGIHEMAARMEEHGFPWDAVIVEGWDTYNPETYGALKELTEFLHGMGKKILVYQGCGRVPYSGNPEGRERIRSRLAPKDEYFVKNAETGEMLLPETDTYNPADSPGKRFSRFVDITNPEALAWWRDFVWGRLIREIGVDGCKIDFCEQFPDHFALSFHDGRRTPGAHHWYPTLYNALMYRYYNENRPEGGMCFSRGGGIGAQRYPFIWAGDQRREWIFLGAILSAVLSSGMSGIPFMSYDMSGYMPAKDPEANPEERVYVRGLQMGCFSANMQTHGTVTRPYDFPERIRALHRTYSRLHQALRPYLKEQGRAACESGVPLLRHLYLYDHTDPKTHRIEDQYMLGDALLVAPVFMEADSRDIYLPAGNWRDIFNGRKYTGGQTLTKYSAPFEKIPVFLRGDHESKVIDGILEGVKGLLSGLEGGK